MIAEWKFEANHICLFREQDALAFSTEGKNGTRTRFKPLLYNVDYAANLVAMFHQTIGENLKNDEPNPSCFIPLLFKETGNNPNRLIALFGRVIPSADKATAELKGLHWGIHDSTRDDEYTLDVQDMGTQEYVRWAPYAPCHQSHTSLSQEVIKKYHRLFTFSIESNSNNPVRIALKHDRSWYEVNGRTCTHALAAYLEDLNDGALQTLRELGLAPTQITNNQCTENEWTYFNGLIEYLDKQPEDKQQIIFAHLETCYPTIFPILLNRIVQTLDAQPIDNSYAVILDTLKQEVFGQDYAISQLATALKAQKEGDTKSRVFLCVGPSGVGKTELAKAVAKIKQNRYVRFDMNQFEGETDLHKLFGSSSGYVGSTDQPLFAKELNPYVSSSSEGHILKKTVTNTVILFDEFEKAHSDVKQTLLTLFDEGYCKVQYTKDNRNLVIHYVFQKCIFIGTSNLYRENIMREYAQEVPPATIAEHFIEWNRQHPTPQSFSSELMGRVKTIPFSPIPRGEIYQALIKSKLPLFFSDLKKSVSCAEIGVAEIDLPQVARLLEERHYGDGTNIRKLKDYFQQEVGTAINQQQGWGNLKDKYLSLTHLNQDVLGIKCVRKIYGRIIQEYPSLEI